MRGVAVPVKERPARMPQRHPLSRQPQPSKRENNKNITSHTHLGSKSVVVVAAAAAQVMSFVRAGKYKGQ